MLIAAQNDTVAPAESNAERLFAALRAPRVVAVVQGASHCFLVDNSMCGRRDPSPRSLL